MLEWLKRHVWKACDRPKRFQGSNPCLSAQIPHIICVGFFVNLSKIISLPYFLMMSRRQVMPMSKLSIPMELLLK